MRKPCREKRDTKKARAWSKELEDDEMLVQDVGSPSQPTIGNSFFYFHLIYT